MALGKLRQSHGETSLESKKLKIEDMEDRTRMMDKWGIEPQTFRMQSGRATTALHALIVLLYKFPQTNDIHTDEY